MQELTQNILHNCKCLSKKYEGICTALYWGCGLCKHSF